MSSVVIPAEAGISSFFSVLPLNMGIQPMGVGDSRFRGNDGINDGIMTELMRKTG